MVTVVLIVLAGPLGRLPPRAWGSDTESERQSLAGLAGVYVAVEPLDDRVRDLLTVDTLRADVELRLRLADVRVLTKAEWLQAAGGPYLYLNVNVLPSSSTDPGLFAYSVLLEINQDVTLQRDRRIAGTAATWSARGLGLAGRNRLEEAMRQGVRDLVDKLINAYLAINPKKP